MPDASSGPASADEFDRELRELTEGSAGEAMFTEPSAAERARGAVARARQPGKKPDSKRGPLAGTLFLVAALMLAAGLGWLGLWYSVRRTLGASAGPVSRGLARAAGPAVARAAGPAVSGTILPVGLFAPPPPSDPFAGTAAEQWAGGATGIVVPAARQVGGFTRAQVAAAYRMTRNLLIAANLNGRTLLGGAPTAFAKLLTPAQRATFLAGLRKSGVTKGGRALSTRTWVASFVPGTELMGSAIKVHGVMSARTAGASGTAVLAIDVNYLFGYAVEPALDPADWTRVVDHEYGSIDFARWDDPGGPLDPWDRTVIANAGTTCGSDDGYIHPAYPSDRTPGTRTPGTRPSGPAVSPYSLAIPRPGDGAACGQATGT